MYEETQIRKQLETAMYRDIARYVDGDPESGPRPINLTREQIEEALTEQTTHYMNAPRLEYIASDYLGDVADGAITCEWDTGPVGCHKTPEVWLVVWDFGEWISAAMCRPHGNLALISERQMHGEEVRGLMEWDGTDEDNPSGL
jgi:hypothetical protein